MTTAAIELKGICKRFGAVQANRDVSFSIERGNIHGIIGENGAGKSTLMSILYGYYQADAGEIFVDGKSVPIPDSQAAIAHGIGMVHQHFMLIDTFTVLENVLLGAEGGFTLRQGRVQARERLLQLGRDYGLEVDPDALVGELSVGLQQRVEILKALYRGARILILDEPTAVLTPHEADHLFRILADLKAQGVTIILITHKLREIMAITDAVTVMRGGALVANVRTADVSQEQLATLMVGRELRQPGQTHGRQRGAPVLEVSDLRYSDGKGCARLKGLSFSVHAGEIVGIAGVAGNGQTELLEVLAGMREPASGSVTYKNQDLFATTGKPRAAAFRRLGIAHIPEDRSTAGLVNAFSAWENAILGYQADAALHHGPLLSAAAAQERCRRFVDTFDVRPGDPLLRIGLFSGGNQQKLVLAREIDRDPDLLLIGQPTRGVDIGAIEFIHQRLVALRDAGKALLLVSVELDEIMALSDRILVMNHGEIVGELSPSEAASGRLGLMMGGIAA